MSEAKIVGPYDLQEVNDMPAIVPMTDEQKLYLISVVAAALRVIIKKTTLDAEESLFGPGEYFWPKDPKKPIKVSKSYRSTRFRDLSLGFRRKDQDSVWSRVGISIHPRNFPDGVYFIDLSASFFADYVLKKSFAEDRPEESIERINVFEFSLKNSTQDIQLKFESREDISSLQDKYPKSFHYLKIIRTGE